MKSLALMKRADWHQKIHEFVNRIRETCRSDDSLIRCCDLLDKAVEDIRHFSDCVSKITAKEIPKDPQAALYLGMLRGLKSRADEFLKVYEKGKA